MSIPSTGTNISKKIYDENDILRFKQSTAYIKIQTVLKHVVEKVKGLEVPDGTMDVSVVTRNDNKNSNYCKREENEKTEIIGAVLKDGPNDSAVLHKHNNLDLPEGPHNPIINLLESLSQLIRAVPPLEGPRRFGNLAFRKWHDTVDNQIEQLFSQFRIPVPEKYLSEAVYYFKASLGSPVRLDYGTGHELSFLAFLGFFQLDDGSGILAIFGKYYDLIRTLITTYSLEPAGSHGVWGLDDHFHLIYILGAAQFLNNGPPINSVLSISTVEKYQRSNLFINGISFIRRIKSGSFHEHSPMLNDILTTVYKWQKVLQGLLRMYDVEVLGKFPVVQHFWFGKFYDWINFQTLQPLPVIVKDESSQRSNTKVYPSLGRNNR